MTSAEARLLCLMAKRILQFFKLLWGGMRGWSHMGLVYETASLMSKPLYEPKICHPLGFERISAVRTTTTTPNATLLYTA